MKPAGSRLDPLFAGLCRLAVRRPWLILGVALLSAIPAAYQASRIKLNTDLGRLLPGNSRAVLAKERLEKSVGDGGYFSVLFEGDDKAALRRAIDDAAARVRALPNVASVSYENPIDFLRRYRYQLVPSRYLKQVLDHVERLEAKANPLVEDLDDGDRTRTAPADDAEIERVIERYLRLHERHESENGRVVGMIVRTEKGVTRLAETRALFVGLQKIATEVGRQNGVWAGVGGSHRNKVDVYDEVRSDVSRSGTVAAIGIVLVLVVSFRSIKILPVIFVPLTIGLTWAYGFVPWLVQDLNTITSFLLMVLFGTGDEFAIHLVKRFQNELAHLDLEAALIETFQSTGRSIVTSGLATTLGMAVLFLSSFRGFSEFGIISGIGTLAIFLSMFVVLPPVLVIAVRHRLIKAEAPGAGWSRVPGPVPTLALAAAAVLAFAWAVHTLRFDYDFTRLQAETPETENIKDKHRAVYPGFSVPGAIYVCRDLAALDQAIAAIDDLRAKGGDDPKIGAVASVRDFVPAAAELAQRRALLAEIQEHLRGGWTRRVKDERARGWIQDIRDFVAPDSALTIDELPPEILRRSTTRDGSGRWTLAVDMSGRSRDGRRAMAFTRELYDATMPPGVEGPTGDKPVLAEILWLVTREGPWLVGLTFLGVFILVLFDRRNLVETLWVLLPLVAGLVLTVGGMAALGWQLNFFNIVVLPNLIGNAVDNGVHYFRRWRETGGDAVATQQELAAPLTTSVCTTMMGYGGLLLAHHAGLRSIGAVAVLGLGCCWLTGVALMPGVLAILSRRARGRTAPA